MTPRLLCSGPLMQAETSPAHYAMHGTRQEVQRPSRLIRGFRALPTGAGAVFTRAALGPSSQCLPCFPIYLLPAQLRSVLFEPPWLPCVCTGAKPPAQSKGPRHPPAAQRRARRIWEKKKKSGGAPSLDKSRRARQSGHPGGESSPPTALMVSLKSRDTRHFPGPLDSKLDQKNT